MQSFVWLIAASGVLQPVQLSRGTVHGAAFAGPLTACGAPAGSVAEQPRAMDCPDPPLLVPPGLSMRLLVAPIAAGSVSPQTPPSAGPVLPAAFASYQPTFGVSEMLAAQRPKAIELSDAYYTRLAIHRYASYATVPLFVAEYFLGQSLYNQTAPPDTAPVSQSLRSWHGLVAGGIAVLFGVNTITGAWNLWEGRAEEPGRARRYVHAALMFVSDAGFVATGMLTPGRRDLQGLGDPNRRRTHRTVAIASMSTALVGDLMMLVWNKH